MALTRREFAERLRTMNRSGSKAPLQNVQLPTNQGNYRTPSMTSTAPGVAENQQAKGTDPASLAKVGGIIGKLGQAGWEKYKANSVLGGLQTADQGINMFPLPEDVLGGLETADQGIVNTPLPSALGPGVPKMAETAANTVPGADVLGGLANAGAVDAATNAQNVLGGLAEANMGAATEAAGNASNFNFPGVGTAIGVGLNLANKNYGKAIGQGAGAAAGSFFGPAGTFLGGTIGGIIGGLFH